MTKKLAALLLVIALLPAAALADTAVKGDRGSHVQDIQQMLIDLGYLFEKADGVYGKNTEEAVKWYQRENGLAETGEVTDELFVKLAEARDVFMGYTVYDTQYCATWLKDDGERGCNLCRTHTQLEGQIRVLIESGDADDRGRALSLWKDEINRLYSILFEMYDDETAAFLANAQVTFFLYLDQQEAAYRMLYPNQPEAVARALELILHDKAIDLCAMTSTAVG